MHKKCARGESWEGSDAGSNWNRSRRIKALSGTKAQAEAWGEAWGEAKALYKADDASE